jgi:glycosyltransferase involved in cell wall biosynthesis
MYYLVALAGKILGKKVYISFHGEDFNRIKNNKIYAFFARIFDGVFAISPHMVPVLKGIHNCPVYFIGNGVDFDNFYNTGKLRKKQIVFVASFKNVKRHDLMLNGFSQFVDNPKYKDYELVLVGEGEKMKSYQDFVEQKSIPNVTFVGQKTSEELLHIYNESEVMCLTSDSEGFPKVVLEALACGCIIVSTKVGSVPDIFGENYPFYIENSNIDSVANALSTAIDNKDEMKEYFGLVKDYSWHQVAEQYENIYKNDLCIN